jgi:hypothetical protein
MKNKDKKKLKFKKVDPDKLVLSFPTNFRHESHIGQIRKGAFEVQNFHKLQYRHFTENPRQRKD